MATETKGLESLFLDGLKDIYYAENKILKALPKMAEAAYTEEVTAAFEKHLTETEGQVARLELGFRNPRRRSQGQRNARRLMA